MLEKSEPPNTVDNSSSSLGNIVPGNKVLSDFCSILDIIQALMRLLATGCLYMEKIHSIASLLYMVKLKSYQHCIISSYIALGQPGGGGSLYPVVILFMYYSKTYNDRMATYYT